MLSDLVHEEDSKIRIRTRCTVKVFDNNQAEVQNHQAKIVGTLILMVFDEQTTFQRSRQKAGAKRQSESFKRT